MANLTRKVTFRVDPQVTEMLAYLCEAWAVRPGEALRRCVRNQFRVEGLAEAARKVNTRQRLEGERAGQATAVRGENNEPKQDWQRKHSEPEEERGR